MKKVLSFLFASAIALTPSTAIAQTYSQQSSFLTMFYSLMAKRYPDRQVPAKEMSEIVDQGLEYCSAISSGITERQLNRQFVIKNRNLLPEEFSYVSAVKVARDVSAVYYFCPEHKEVLGY